LATNTLKVFNMVEETAPDIDDVFYLIKDGGSADRKIKVSTLRSSYETLSVSGDITGNNGTIFLDSSSGAVAANIPAY